MGTNPAPTSDLWPIQFQPSVAVDAFAVMEGTGATTNHGEVVVTTQQYAAGDPRKTIYVNGPADVAADAFGRCSTAMVRPVMALGSGSAGDTIGPSDASWELSAAHPGFTIVGASPVSGTVLVLRQTEMTRCQGLAAGAVGTGDGTFSVDNVEAYSGLEPVASSGDTLTVENVFSDAIDDDGVVTFSWNRSSNQWETDDAECPS